MLGVILLGNGGGGVNLQALREEALRLGFLAVGIAPGSALEARHRELSQWVANGFSGRLGYMEQFFKRQELLRSRMPDLKSIIVLACAYGQQGSRPAEGQGRIARYAQGRDYHRAIEKRLKCLEEFLRRQLPEGKLRVIRSVDTSAVQERVLAETAGLGFFGKNTCLILPKGGSFVFLSALLTNLELPADPPTRWDCGECTLCLQACPTDALVRPYELDARRCISYLTIELKEAIDPALRPRVGDWLFGCDICQEVCPYNRKSPSGTWDEFHPQAGAGASLPLEEILRIRTDEEFTQRFAGTPLMRAKRQGLLRNAAVVAGNLKDPQFAPALADAFQNDSSPVVRDHSSWALKEIIKP